MLRALSKKNLAHIVSLLETGGIVAIPTETVYGLAADATNETAIRKVYTIKQRPLDHPLIVHIADTKALSEWALDIPEAALCLANHFWPGPLTLILKKHPHVSPAITGGQDTVALRVPSSVIAQSILHAFGKGLVMPSANRFGHVSPTLAEHVKEDLGEQVDEIIDGGVCSIGIESTVIDCTQTPPAICRPGMLTPERIQTETGISVSILKKPILKVSGNLASHYAPDVPTQCISEKALHDWVKKFKCHPERTAILSRSLPKTMAKNVIWIKMPNDEHAYAHSLYEKLREAEHQECQCIIIEDVPDTPEWSGVRDRIKKASG